MRLRSPVNPSYRLLLDEWVRLVLWQIPNSHVCYKLKLRIKMLIKELWVFRPSHVLPKLCHFNWIGVICLAKLCVDVGVLSWVNKNFLGDFGGFIQRKQYWSLIVWHIRSRPFVLLHLLRCSLTSIEILENRISIALFNFFVNILLSHCLINLLISISAVSSCH